MNKSMKFMKIDMLTSISQIKLMGLFFVVGIFIAVNIGQPVWALTYLCFGMIVFSTTPFTTEQTQESGFLSLLPASIKNRVYGRYLYLVILMLGGITSGIIAMLISKFFFSIEITNDQILLAFLSVGVSMIISSLQFLLFYKIGKIKSQQLMGFIRMVPAFIYFFGISYFYDNMGDELMKYFKYVMEHTMEICLFIALFTLLIFWLCAKWSTRICEKKDE